MAFYVRATDEAAQLALSAGCIPKPPIPSVFHPWKSVAVATISSICGSCDAVSSSAVLTASLKSDTVTLMATITIKQLHAKTGEEVRKAGKSRNPVAITDHGRLVAVLAAPHLYRPTSRRRVLLPEYAALLKKTGANDVLEDLDAVRGDR